MVLLLHCRSCLKQQVSSCQHTSMSMRKPSSCIVRPSTPTPTSGLVFFPIHKPSLMYKAHYNLAVALDHHYHMYEEARVHYLKTIELRPSSTGACMCLSTSMSVRVFMCVCVCVCVCFCVCVLVWCVIVTWFRGVPQHGTVVEEC